MSEALILTLRMDAASFAQLDEERRRYFPAERNCVPAHVTLFHHLPERAFEEIDSELRQHTEGWPRFDILVAGLRPLGFGVAYQVHSPTLVESRNRLAAKFEPWLNRQDQQPYRPHITVQNKVTPAEAKQTLISLQAAFQPFSVGAEGLELWRYLGGPWERLAAYDFCLPSLQA